jgi:UDP-GlcNAc3NAcA epimerase
MEEVIVHTGQHYDANMSDVFFNELQIPQPKYNLEVGSGSHGEMTAKMLSGLEEIISKENPTAVLVYGDTNSTIAGALAASKLHCPVVHIEAGLRSFNKWMPEEINRIACDHMSTLLFSPTLTGIQNLNNEGFNLDQKSVIDINSPGVFHCGDIMLDNSLYFSKISDEKSTIIKDLDMSADFILCTIHRDTNTDHPTHLNSIFAGLLQIQEMSNKEIVLPLHPRTKAKMNNNLKEEIQKKIKENKQFKIIEPIGFLDMIALQKKASIVITDSGGLQKESYFFGKPCIVLREETEWIEILETGNAILAGTNSYKIKESFVVLNQKQNLLFPSLFGNGEAAEFICQEIIKHL